MFAYYTYIIYIGMISLFLTSPKSETPYRQHLIWAHLSMVCLPMNLPNFDIQKTYLLHTLAIGGILPKLNIAPEDRPSQKERIVSQASMLRCENVSFRDGISSTAHLTHQPNCFIWNLRPRQAIMDQLFDTHKASRKFGKRKSRSTKNRKMLQQLEKGMSCLCRHVYVTSVYIYTSIYTWRGYIRIYTGIYDMQSFWTRMQQYTRWWNKSS